MLKLFVVCLLRVDITQLQQCFPAGSPAFDVVIDKCTIDALTVDPGDKWDPDEPTRTAVNAVVTGVAALLAPAGVFVSISFEQKQFRRPLLEASHALVVRLHRYLEMGFKEVFVYHMTLPKEPAADVSSSSSSSS